jgi:L-aminopeptidase/D-esterase-like protein
LNAITDIGDVQVGYATLIEGAGCRTGVTIILPRGRDGKLVPTRAAYHSFNGNGELTGSHWISEAGHFTGPIAITNTNGIGAAHEGLQRWLISRAEPSDVRWFLPVAAETYDGFLNDIEKFHVRPYHILQAIAEATGGQIAEGNVGGGTGMRCYGFKGGSGTSSRKVLDTQYAVGAFVQANFGRRHELRARGVPLGQMMPLKILPEPPGSGAGSIIVVLAIDAPLSAAQLAGVARRATVGVARTGTCGHHDSGDIFLAFSTVEPMQGDVVDDGLLSSFFDAAAAAVEEAILNALVGARSMVGFQGRSLEAIDHDEIVQIARAYDNLLRAAGEHR